MRHEIARSERGIPLQLNNGFGSAKVEAVFAAYPDNVRTKLPRRRELIFETAAATDGAGELEETLKWGQPSYLTTASKSGTNDPHRSDPFRSRTIRNVRQLPNDAQFDISGAVSN
jgi:hypothetical protein